MPLGRPPPTPPPLPDHGDLQRLEKLEAIVRTGLELDRDAAESRIVAKNTRTAAARASNATARALHEIQNHAHGMFWRQEFKSFVDYCADKWCLKKTHAYRLAEFGSFLSETIIFSPDGENITLSESIFRQFCAVVPEDHRVECWCKITAGKGATDLTAAAIKSAARKYLEERRLDPVPEKMKVPMGYSQVKTTALNMLENLGAVIAGLPLQDKIHQTLIKLTALIEQDAETPVIEVEAMAMDVTDVVAIEIQADEVAPAIVEGLSENPLESKVNTDRCAVTPPGDAPALSTPCKVGVAPYNNLTGPPATGERKPATVPARKWMANEITPRRTYMAARKFHRAVMPGTDFKEWLEVVSAKHPGDFGISKTGDPTISLVRARQIAFLTTGAMCKNAMEIIQSVEKGGAEESGAMINARFDDLANETYVSSASVKHGAEWSDNGDNEASTLPSPKSP